MMNAWCRRLPVLLVLLCALTAGIVNRSEAQRAPRRTILLTNDNGIDDRATLALARALSKKAEVILVAPATDRSGASNYMPSASGAAFTVTSRRVGPGITAFAVDGYPADCVAFALAGPLRDHRPDLVLSGINGGPNLADAWLGSGTIGAARTAAYLGVPAVAVSGVEDDDPRSLEAVVGWVVRFLDSPIVENLEAPEYLTVSLPVVPPDEIRGVEITTRARGLLEAKAERSGTKDGKEVWTIQVSPGRGSVPNGSDVAAVHRGMIAIVAARAGEYDPALADRLKQVASAIPAWSPPEASGGSRR